MTAPPPPPADAPPTAAVPAAEPIAPAHAKWPNWFAPTDTAVAVLVVIAAFLAAAFPASNSDLWRHLAAGRLIAHGQFPFGGDPFSYTAADRAWVDPNWLAEAALYAVYSLDPNGAVLVAGKAVLFAAAVGLVFLLRKPGTSLLPWAVAAGAATIVCVQQAQLRPLVAGMALTSVTLAAVFRGNWAAGRWRMPLVLGGITALWANVDSFALLAPLTILLALVGELVQKRLPSAGSDPVPELPDPFPPSPPVNGLALALGLSVVGLLLNPTFLAAAVHDPVEAVRQLLPFELDVPTKGVMKDDRSFQNLTLAVSNPKYLGTADLGGNLNGWSAVALFAAGVAALTACAVGRVRVSAPLAAVWVGGVMLALFGHYRFLPYFALASVPLIATHLTALGRRVRLGRVGEQATGLWLGAGNGARIAALAVGGWMVLAGVPGWLHPRFENAEFNRRLGFGVEEDPGLKRGAELLQGWRTDPAGDVLEGTRGLALDRGELGDFCAWSAPAEKGFADTRHRLHRAELPDLVALRQELVFGGPADDAGEAGATTRRLAEKYRAGYVCLGFASNRLDVVALDRTVAAFAAAGDRGAAVDRQLWHLDGRFAVVGRADDPTADRRVARLAGDLARSAFAADTDPPPPAPVAAGAPRAEGLAADFAAPPRRAALESDDAVVYAALGDLFARERQAAQARAVQRTQLVAAAVQPLGPLLGTGLTALVPPPVVPPADEARELALPVLAIRAARRGAADSPDHPDAYSALADAYAMDLAPAPFLPPEPFPAADNRAQVIAAHVRRLARLPEPEAGGTRLRHPLTSARDELAVCKLRLQAGGQFDLALAALHRTNQRVLLLTDDTQSAAVLLQPDLFDLWQAWGTVMAARVLQGAAANQRPQFGPQYTAWDFLAQKRAVEREDNPRQWLPKDWTPGAALPPSLVRERLGALERLMEEWVKQPNDAWVAQGERIDRGPAPPGQKVLQKAGLAIQFGLPGTAVDVLKQAVTGDGGATVDGPEATDLSLLLIAAELAYGFLEDGSRHLDQFREQVAKGAGSDAVQQQVRRLEFRRAVLAGDYPKADELFAAMSEGRLGNLAAAERAALTTPAQDAALATPGIPALAGMIAAAAVLNRADASQRAKERLWEEAAYFHNRGLFALLSGDSARAADWFRRGLRPQGLDLFGTYGVPDPLRALPVYSALLDKHHPPAKGTP